VNFSTSYSANEFINAGDVHKATKHPYLTNSSGELIDKNGAVIDYNDIGSLPGISYKYGGPRDMRSRIFVTLIVRTMLEISSITITSNKCFKTGYTTNNALNISGANDKSDYGISVANNHTLSPVMKNGAVDRSNISLNLGTELFKGFKIRSTTQVVYTKNNLDPSLGAAGGYGYGKGNSLEALMVFTAS